MRESNSPGLPCVRRAKMPHWGIFRAREIPRAGDDVDFFVGLCSMEIKKKEGGKTPPYETDEDG